MGDLPMENDEKMRFRRLAVSKAKEQWHRGWGLLSESQQEAYIAQAACMIVLGQSLDKYAPAQELLRACLSPELDDA